MNQEKQVLACPRCGQIDSVRKVTTIVSEGTSTAQARSDSSAGTTRGESQTLLASRLSPPSAPTNKWLIVLKLLFVAVVCVFILSFLNNKLAWVGILLGVLAIVIALWALKSEESNPEYQRYRRALNRWDQLYYCYRDDIVFIPGENRAISPEQMHSYLYELSK